MFKKYFLLLIVVVSSFSCYHENQETITVPENLLTKDQMVDILTDIQLSEGILTYRRIERLPVNNYGESLYNKVIEEHQLTREQLQQNIDYYNGNPKLMEKIYDEVLGRLNKMQTELMIMAAKSDSIAEFKNDSIQKNDSSERFLYFNFVLIQESDTTTEKTDSLVIWNYNEWIKIPGFIY
ncbi:MAG TPA: DUF4296 domain-containing protein [Bacteroidales bacterium]